MQDQQKHVFSLIAKAAHTDKADEALKYSQAACNAANAMCAVGDAMRNSKLEKL